MHPSRFLRTSCLAALLSLFTMMTACVHAQHDETVSVQQAHGGGPVRSTERHVNCMARGATLRGGCD